jgi:hypothetical protein
MSIYKSKGKTAQEAFEGIWELLKFTDDYALRKVGDEYEMRLKIVKPTRKELEEFEVMKLSNY